MVVEVVVAELKMRSSWDKCGFGECWVIEDLGGV